MESKQEVGRITHFYPKISVAVVELKVPLAVGEKIAIVGKTTNLTQVVESMQIEHSQVRSAKGGQSVGLRVAGRVRESDMVYK